MAKPAKLSASEVNALIKKEAVTKFIAFLDEGPGAWQKGHVGASLGRPVNMATGEPYRGMNAITLGIMSGRGSNQWVTYNQLEGIRDKMRSELKKEGVAEDQIEGRLPHVRKGEKGTTAIFAKPSVHQKEKVDVQTGESKTEERVSFLYSRFTVFNAEQIENCPVATKGMDREFEPIQGAEIAMAAMVEKTGLKIFHDSGNYYSPSKDEIHLFPKEVFVDEYSYYSTGLHELIHSTLSPNRMDRRDALGKRLGDKAYALEELRADIGSLLLAMDIGISTSDEHIRNHAAYVASWREALSKDPSELFKAMSDATKCADYVMTQAREYAQEKGLSVGPQAAAEEASEPTPSSPERKARERTMGPSR